MIVVSLHKTIRDEIMDNEAVSDEIDESKNYYVIVIEKFYPTIPAIPNVIHSVNNLRNVLMIEKFGVHDLVNVFVIQM